MFQVNKKILIFAGILLGMLIASPVSYAATVPSCSEEIATANSYNGFIAEQSDLDIKTARVVELTESLPGGGDTADSKIISAYKGTCCVSKGKNDSCNETANVYTLITDLATCERIAGKGSCIPIQILVSTSGVNLLKFYVLQLYIWAASIVGIIAVLIIVISGIQIAASGGSDQISSAKTRITQSLAGLAILFLSALILYTINPTFFTK